MPLFGVADQPMRGYLKTGMMLPFDIISEVSLSKPVRG
jgi:hypothetical protein